MNYLIMHSFVIRTTVILMFCLANKTSAELCPENDSVVHTDGNTYTINANGVLCTNNRTYEKDVFEVIESNNTKLVRLCPCIKSACIRKCCPPGEVLVKRNCTQDPENSLIETNQLSVYQQSVASQEVAYTTYFGILNGKLCERSYVETDPWFVQEDGSLYLDIPHTWMKVYLPKEQYCLETKRIPAGYELVAKVCFQDEVNRPPPMSNTLKVVGFSISNVLMLLTLAVYAAVPELRNTHGRVLCGYLAALAMSFLMHTTSLLLIDYYTFGSMEVFVYLSFLHYFFFMSALFWLNVMCFDIYWTFSGATVKLLSRRNSRRQLWWYIAYALGLPAALTALLVAMQYADLPSHIVTPKLGLQGTFLFGESKLVYFVFPLLILCATNALLFALTACRIAVARHDTAAVLDASGSHRHRRKEKQRYMLYVKLFVIMGVGWVFEGVSAIYPGVPVLWFVCDLYNMSTGIIIFAIVICKKKTFKLIKKRYGSRPASQATTVTASTCSRTESVWSANQDRRCEALKLTSVANK